MERRGVCVCDWLEGSWGSSQNPGRKSQLQNLDVGLGCSTHLSSSRNQSPSQIETGKQNPLLQGCSTCTWTQLMQWHTNKLYGTKSNCMLGQLEQFWTKDTKRPESYCHLKSQEQNQGAGSKSRILNVPPAFCALQGARSVSCFCSLHLPPSKKSAKHLRYPCPHATEGASSPPLSKWASKGPGLWMGFNKF